MSYYAPSAGRLDITGLDPNTAMQDYARENAANWGLAGSLHLVQGSAQAMPFGGKGQPPVGFDAAVVTLVLCSVPDPIAALSEIRRVVRPGGKLLLIEHVLAPEPGLLRLQQRLLDPLQGLLADGCHLTRDTAQALPAAGWRTEGNLERFSLPGLSVIGPHIAGVLEA
jgi:SAM-dependent methyltransferase